MRLVLLALPLAACGRVTVSDITYADTTPVPLDEVTEVGVSGDDLLALADAAGPWTVLSDDDGDWPSPPTTFDIVPDPARSSATRSAYSGSPELEEPWFGLEVAAWVEIRANDGQVVAEGPQTLYTDDGVDVTWSPISPVLTDGAWPAWADNAVDRLDLACASKLGVSLRGSLDEAVRVHLRVVDDCDGDSLLADLEAAPSGAAE